MQGATAEAGEQDKAQYAGHQKATEPGAGPRVAILAGG